VASVRSGVRCLINVDYYQQARLPQPLKTRVRGEPHKRKKYIYRPMNREKAGTVAQSQLCKLGWRSARSPTCTIMALEDQSKAERGGCDRASVPTASSLSTASKRLLCCHSSCSIRSTRCRQFLSTVEREKRLSHSGSPTLQRPNHSECYSNRQKK
jgi:hypothetical protein